VKIRTGFVSNSSSASFTVTAYTDLAHVRQMIIEKNYWSFFDRKNFADLIKNKIALYKSRDKDKTIGLYFEEEDMRPSLVALHDRIPTLSNEEFFMEVLKQYYIIVREEKEKVIFTYHTSMFNSFDDSLNPLYKEIICTLVFSNIKTICMVEED